MAPSGVIAVGAAGSFGRSTGVAAVVVACFEGYYVAFYGRFVLFCDVNWRVDLVSRFALWLRHGALRVADP